MPSKTRLISEAVPILIYLSFMAAGYFLGALITCSIAGGLIAGIVRMKIRDQNWKTLSPRSHIVLTILLSSATATLLLGWARNWKTFALNAALAPLPILLVPALIGAQFSAGIKEDREDSAKQFAVLEEHVDLVERDAALFAEGFKDGSLVHLGTEYLREDSWGVIRNEPYDWSMRLMRMALRAASQSDPKTPTRDYLSDVADATQYDTVTVFVSRSAHDANHARRNANALEATGYTLDELYETPENAELLSSVPDLDYQGITMLLCQYNSDTGELINLDTMPFGYRLDGIKIDALAPLQNICEAAAQGVSLDHLSDSW